MIVNENLPDEWEIKLLSEVCDVRDGTHDSPKYVEDGFPLITSKNVTNGYVDFSNVNLISKEDYDKVNKRSFVDNGDILMPMIGTIGNPIIVKKEREFAIKNVALIKFTKTDISNIYVKHLLNSEYFKYYIKRTNRGVTQKFLALKDIRGFPILIPPLETQKKIVEILEKAEKLKKWRVEADKLVDEFLKSVFLDIFGDPGTNKKEWPIDNLKNSLIDVKNGLSRRRKIPENTGQVVLRLREIRKNKIDFEDLNRIPLEESEKNKYQAQKNDILFIRVNGNKKYVGRCAVFEGYMENVYFNDHIMRVKIDLDSYNPLFLAFLINSDFGKIQLNRHLRTSAGQYTINQKGLERLKLYIPPIKLQNQFAEVLKQVETLKTHQKQSKQQIDNLFNVIMQKAFKGELTC